MQVQVMGKSLSPKEEADLKNRIRRQPAELSNANPLTGRDKILLWLLILGTVGGLVAAFVWHHTLYSGGVVR